MSLTFRTSEIADVYDVDVTFAPTGSERGAQVDQVRVEVTPTSDQDLFLEVYMYGHVLTAAGKRSMSSSHGHIYGQTQSEERYNLAREAVLATIERHGFDATKIEDSLAHQTWAEFAKDQRNRLGF